MRCCLSLILYMIFFFFYHEAHRSTNGVSIILKNVDFSVACPLKKAVRSSQIRVLFLIDTNLVSKPFSTGRLVYL